MTPAPAYWRLCLPYPLALPADLAERWLREGRTDVRFCGWQEAMDASRAAAEPPAREPVRADAQGGLFGTEAA